MWDDPEFGVLLRDNTVAPAASFQAAADQAVALGRPLVRRWPLSLAGWQEIACPLPLWQPRFPTPGRSHTFPGHGTVAAHRRAGEPWCRACCLWWAVYMRPVNARVRSRRKAAA